ncbi:hypothetical protein [Flavobacterium caeni]|uniref:Right handed beta helix region n=1 Tax=Flavobacterium caeni TaxID=490189 RepID=A0A1G5ALK4_9FLAO|nr:hypothetical protein [Flavobacterium caeni]SCX78747.1 hypothetical protein SAMN02927903_00054 [Flavobacterium caeni]
MKKLTPFAIAALLVLNVACSSDETTPIVPPTAQTLTVQTADPQVSGLNAIVGGSIASFGTEPILETGVILANQPDQTIESLPDGAYPIALETNQFEEALLFDASLAGMPIYVRAYAKTATQVVYGDSKMFVLEGCTVHLVTPDGPVTINAPQTWASGEVHVITQNVTITSQLTIEPGAIVKVDGAQIRVNPGGTIQALGTLEAPIVFTSLKDDVFCGDTNSDGASEGQKGDWTGIYLTAPGSQFTYCGILYAGANDGGYYNAVRISGTGADFGFDHCVFAYTLGHPTASAAFAFYGGATMKDATESQFTNNAFYGNDRPIYLNIYYNFNPNNQFFNPDQPAESNTRNGIWTWHTTMPGVTATFMEDEAPYVVDAFFNGGGSAATDGVIIGPNVIVKFNGTLSGISRAANRNISIDASAALTSYKDDLRGGDTNGDGNATFASDGDWDGYYNYQTTTYLGGANIFYDAH